MLKRETGTKGVESGENWEKSGPGAFRFDEPDSLKRFKALMAPVEFKIAIVGTRPGTGVSTFTFNLALALRRTHSGGSDSELQGAPTIGILDLGGSSFPSRLGPQSHGLERRGLRFLPARGLGNLKVVSLDMLMGDRLTPTGDWSSVQVSLGKVEWGRLDFLLMELPSGIEAVGNLSEVLPAIDAALIVSLPTDGEKQRIRRMWKFFDVSSIPVIGLVSNMDGRLKGEDVGDLGQTFGIPIRVAIPHEPALAGTQAEAGPYILARQETKIGKIFSDLSEDLVDYLVWLHDEHEQEEDF